ncbi:unnamed protein product, partial [Linum tenue]
FLPIFPLISRLPSPFCLVRTAPRPRRQGQIFGCLRIMVMGFELWQGRPIDGALGCQIPVQVDKHSAIASEMVQKDLDDKERKPCPNAASRRNPLITSHDCHSKIDWCQTASSFIEQERILCHELESMVTLSSRSEAKSIEPVADDNIVEINPLRISPPNARDSGRLLKVTA